MLRNLTALTAMRLIKASRLISMLALPLLAFPIIAWTQSLLGWEVALFPLFMAPVAIMAWNFGWKGGTAGVLLGMAFWLRASYTSEHPFTNDWTRYFNALIRGSVFAATAFFILVFKRVIAQHRSQMEAMRALLNVCHGCGSIQGSDGQWIPVDQLVGRKQNSSCECPQCAASQLRHKS